MPSQPRRTQGISPQIERLEDRLAMSADALAGPLTHHQFDTPPLGHHLIDDAAPPIESPTESPDFWINDDDRSSWEQQLDEIEQMLSDAHDQTGWNQVQQDYGFIGRGQTVAVIDSGLAYDHFALGGGFGDGFRVVGGWDFTEENDADPYDDGPSGSHGTHVGGIIGSGSPTHTGVAPGVDLVGLRVFNDAGEGYFHWVESALDWVHQHRNDFASPITAINLSLGVSSWNADAIPNWANLEDEFAQLEADGVFISVSAGNSFTSYNQPGLSYPAASPYVIPVMSTDDSGLLSYYSQRHARAIAAPGRSITSTVPDYKGDGNGTTDDFRTKSGTSMAAPYVAGASVLIREAMEFAGSTNVTQDAIYDHMIATADDFFDTSTEQWYKRLNLEAAIDALMPSDDFGSTIESAYDLGAVSEPLAMSGAISTLNDVDYFTFTSDVTGSVTFTATNTSHDVVASWQVYGADTLNPFAVGDSVTFGVESGQTYCVSFASGDGLGYYDFEVAAESTFSFVGWGEVTQDLYQDIAIDGDSWYHVVASQDGILTAQAFYNAAAGQIALELYDVDQNLIVGGSTSGGESRLDVVAQESDEYFLRVVGDHADVDFQLTNLVSVSDGVVTAVGGDGDDDFMFTAGQSYGVSVNGVDYSFTSAEASRFRFQGGAGVAPISLFGSAAAENVVLHVGSGSVSADAYSATTAEFENQTVYGGGGADVVRSYDSKGDDRFDGYSDRAILAGDGFHTEMRNFGRVYAYSSDGYDEAYFYDTAGDDAYVGRAHYALLWGDGYRNYTEGFERSFAYATDGNDRATFYDSAGNDQYVGWSDRVTLQGDGFSNEAHGFRRTYARASEGDDQATFYDTPGDDLYVASSTRAVMYGAGYWNWTGKFNRTYAYASEGNDKATMRDTLGDDVYLASSTRVVMYGAGYWNYAANFNRTNAYSTQGDDRVEFEDSAGDDIYVGRVTEALMRGDGYWNHTYGFGATYAEAGQGNDRAVLFGSEAQDEAYAQLSTACMTDSTYRNEVCGFKRVNVVNHDEIADLVHVDAVDFLFRQVGNWTAV